jgi:hypothetical protein
VRLPEPHHCIMVILGQRGFGQSMGMTMHAETPVHDHEAANDCLTLRLRGAQGSQSARKHVLRATRRILRSFKVLAAVVWVAHRMRPRLSTYNWVSMQQDSDFHMQYVAS